MYKRQTWFYIDEFHLLLKGQTGSFSVEIWKRFRKWGGIPSGLTQNVKDLSLIHISDHFALRQYKKYKLAAGKTAKSILIRCGARLAPFDIKEVREITMYDELELALVGDCLLYTSRCV